MAGNVQPLFTKTPNVGFASIPTANAQVKSDGTSAGTGADIMYLAFTAGGNGSFVSTVRFFSVATAVVTGAPTVLRAYLSTVAAPGATTNANTHLIGEISVPAVPSANASNATSPYDIPVGFAIPNGLYIHVSQHAAQTANQNWACLVLGGDY